MNKKYNIDPNPYTSFLIKKMLRPVIDFTWA